MTALARQQELPIFFSEFDSAEGKKLLHQKLELFQSVIAHLEDIYNVHPFNQQSAQSLLEMWAFVTTLRPKSVIEIGTGTRSSTIALALAAADVEGCTVYGIDIQPTNFSAFSRQYFPEFSFGPVVDTKIDLARYEIPASLEGPVFMLYDAHDHDIPGTIISSHAVKNWFPSLSGQVIGVHDCCVMAADDGIDYKSPYVKARHWSGQYVTGYPEVGPLVEWMNQNHVDFWRPGNELELLDLNGKDSSLIAFTVP